MAGQLAMQGGSLLSARTVAQMQQHPTVGFTFGMKTLYTQAGSTSIVFTHHVMLSYSPVQGGVNFFQDGYDSTTMDAPEDDGDEDRF